MLRYGTITIVGKEGSTREFRVRSMGDVKKVVAAANHLAHRVGHAEQAADAAGGARLRRLNPG